MTATRTRNGFSLVELSIVVIVIGVIATFAVPQLMKAVERAKAAEAFKYCASLQGAQERYQDRQGTYALDRSLLDMTQGVPKYFAVGALSAGSTGNLEDSWTITLTRIGASSGYGAYTVTFTHEGYDAENSTINMLPEINPLGG